MNNLHSISEWIFLQSLLATWTDDNTVVNGTVYFVIWSCLQLVPEKEKFSLLLVLIETAVRWSWKTWPELNPPHQGHQGAFETGTSSLMMGEMFHLFITSHPPIYTVSIIVSGCLSSTVFHPCLLSLSHTHFTFLFKFRPPSILIFP